jgi:bacterial microcompartment shell protein
MAESIGMVECTSIAIGHEVEDAMLKAADVELVLARTICSGKFAVLVRGDVGAVTASIDAGVDAAREGLIDHFVIPSVHPSVFPAIGQSVALAPEQVGAMGVIETFSAASAIEAGDAAVKAGNVELFRIYLAMAVGGKGYVQVTGEVSAVEAAVASGVEVASRKGLLVARCVIPRPRPELFREFV